MDKFTALWNLFKLGNAVADPALWKRRQITATALGAAIVALVQVLKAFGVAIPVDPDSATALAGGVVALVNIVLTVTTTEKIGVGDGVPPLDAAAPRGGEAGRSADEKPVATD